MGHVDRAVSGLATLRARLRPAPPAPIDLRVVNERLDKLEAMVEGLQDSVFRESKRQTERLNELARRVEPGELARILSEDARRRGL